LERTAEELPLKVGSEDRVGVHPRQQEKTALLRERQRADHLV